MQTASKPNLPMEPIVVEQKFNCPKEKVWQALTVAAAMQLWFFKEIDAFALVEDFEMRFDIHLENRTFPHRIKLIKFIPQEQLIYDWRYEGYQGKAKVTFDLVEVKNQTILKLTHEVVEKFSDEIPEFRRESGVAGWEYFIQKSLKEYLEKK